MSQRFWYGRITLLLLFFLNITCSCFAFFICPQLNYSILYINRKLFCYLDSNLATSFKFHHSFLDHIYGTVVNCVYGHIILKSQYPTYSSVVLVLHFYYMLTISTRLNTKPGFYITCLLCSFCIIPSIPQFFLASSTSMATIFPKLSSVSQYHLMSINLFP